MVDRRRLRSCCADNERGRNDRHDREHPDDTVTDTTVSFEFTGPTGNVTTETYTLTF